MQRALAAGGLPPDPSVLPRFLEIYGSRLLNHTTRYPGMRDAVEIARRGGARVTVLTNKPLAPSERILDAPRSGTSSTTSSVVTVLKGASPIWPACLR